MDIIEDVRRIIAGYMKERGIEVVDITYRREQGGMTLRILADKPEGISVSDCEELNNYLSEALDREDVMQDHYILEVSSPGLDRPIVTDRDFERSIGKILDITTYQPVDTKKAHEGKLIGVDKEKIVVESDGISTVIPRAVIASAKLKIEI